MKKQVIGQHFLILVISALTFSIHAQKVGIGILAPLGKLHIKGSENVSQLIIDGNSTQSNTNPLIKLRQSNGTDLIWIHSDNPGSVFVGNRAGYTNNGGYNNSFIGSYSGYSNTTGYNNTATGYKSLEFNTTGFANTANGIGALGDNTIGYGNTAIGSYSLYINTTASSNTAIGLDALRDQSFNNNNTSWISGNTAVGSQALYANNPTSTSNGIYNTAIGYKAMRLNTIGYDNTVIGESALYSNTDGFRNSAVGRQSLEDNIGGDDNAAFGWRSLPSNTIGNKNTSIGNNSLNANTSGMGNTAIGYNSLYSNTNGELNCAFGQSAYFTAAGLDNTTCIGYLSGGISNVSNRVEIGNSSVSWIGGQIGWGTYSDGRIKNNIQENVPGLSFINRLRPVTYNLDIHKQNEMIGKEGTEGAEWPTKYDIENIRMTGFIAQEVEQAALETGFDFSGVQKPQAETGLYSIRYSEFVMPLVKAVQELSVINETQASMIDTMQNTIDMLALRLTELEKVVNKP